METLTIALISVIFLLILVIGYMIIQKRRKDAESQAPIVVYKNKPRRKPLIKPLGPFRFPHESASTKTATLEPMAPPSGGTMPEGFSNMNHFHLQRQNPSLSRKFTYQNIG
jgi:hypothetical protein